MGVLSDQRSDIFAFGILLLHLLLSEDSVPVEPSLGALQGFLYKAGTLKEPWKGLVLQMTALEPAQRIANAPELLKKLLPFNDKPVACMPQVENVSIPSNVLNEKLLCVYSPSEGALESAYNRILIDSWQNGTNLYSFHFNQISPEDSFQKLCLALTGKKMDDPYTGFRAFQDRKKSSGITILFRFPEILSPEQRAMFFFGASCLAEYEWIRIVLLSTKSWVSSVRDSWKHFALPANGQNDTTTSIESLAPAPRKMLNALAVAGGKLSASMLESFGDSRSILELQQRGLISIKNEHTSLSFSTELLLSRMRSSQKASTAARILQKNEGTLDPVSIFHLATTTANDRLAARAALLAARKVPNLEKGLRFEWYWNAFNSKAKLPRSLLVRLTKFFLRSGDYKKARKLLKHIRLRFGFSFQLADLRLNFLHRKHELDAAIRSATRYTHLAKLRAKKGMEEYFLVRLAGFQVLRQDLILAKKTLDMLPVESSDQVAGLRHHFQGLLYFFHGNLSASLNEFQQASRIKHRFQSSSVMNIGVVLGKMGQSEAGEKWLKRSIRIFSKIQDKDRLSHAFLNLGLNYQISGRTEQARTSYVRGMHLSRASRNPNNYIVSLNNIGTLYEREGRIDKSVVIWSKVFKLACREIRSSCPAILCINKCCLASRVHG